MPNDDKKQQDKGNQKSNEQKSDNPVIKEIKIVKPITVSEVRNSTKGKNNDKREQ